MSISLCTIVDTLENQYQNSDLKHKLIMIKDSDPPQEYGSIKGFAFP